MAEPSPEKRLASLGLVLPPPPTPLGAYVPWVRAGSLLYLSGQLPLREGRIVHPGLVGEGVTVAEGIECARIAALNGLAVVRSALGSLGAVSRVVRLAGHVAAPASFTAHPQVVNGASELLVEVFGEAGRHARVALGAPSLPANACVELEILFETR
jgi:enamine deaminase RidA (YjgF/YER057c/UK114 family)